LLPQTHHTRNNHHQPDYNHTPQDERVVIDWINKQKADDSFSHVSGQFRSAIFQQVPTKASADILPNTRIFLCFHDFHKANH